MNSCRRLCVFVATLLTLAVAQSAVAAGKPPGDLTGPWQLFLDDYLVSSKTNVQRRYHQFKKIKDNPLIRVDKPWERDVVMCGTVLPNEDGSGYRMYYGSWAPKNDPGEGYTCLAVSKDGLTWEKPNLGLHEWKGDGKTENNILPGAAVHVMYTPWESDPERKYYAVEMRGGKYVANTSPDGLHWKQISKDAIVNGGDTSHFYWDPNTKLFRCTVKGGANDKVSGDVSGMRRRVVGYSETKDVNHFPPLRMVMAPDDQDDRWCNPESVERTHFYACPVIPYETAYVGLLQIYRPNDPEGFFHGPLWLELVTSRDGMHFIREEGDRPPVLNVGKFRTWDFGMVYSNSLVVVGDEIRMYYSGYDDLHDLLPYHSCIGLATLRKDGFVSLNADESPGEVVTHPFTGASGSMLVNCEAKNGWLRVEVQDREGRVVPGYGLNDCEPVTGTGVRQVVTWKSHKELPTNAGPIRFRFNYVHAELYSFMVGDNVKMMEEAGPPPLQALYTFEGTSDSWSDMLPADGLQVLHNLGTCKLDYKHPNPAFGKRSLEMSEGWRPQNRVEIGGTSDLGRHFTLGAMVITKNNKHARLFSAYNGNFAVSSAELIFDFDPRGKIVNGLRLVCKGMPIESDVVKFDDGKYHHLAVTYDDGRVTFYLDGKAVGEQWIPGGEPVKLARNLLIGEDLNRGTDEQLFGNVDDVLVLGWVLPAEQIKTLAEKGAEAVLLKSAGK